MMLVCVFYLNWQILSLWWLNLIGHFMHCHSSYHVYRCRFASTGRLKVKYKFWVNSVLTRLPKPRLCQNNDCSPQMPRIIAHFQIWNSMTMHLRRVPLHREMGSLAGPAHLLNDNAGACRWTQWEQTSHVEQEWKKGSLAFDFQYEIKPSKHGLSIL